MGRVADHNTMPRRPVRPGTAEVRLDWAAALDHSVRDETTPLRWQHWKQYTLHKVNRCTEISFKIHTWPTPADTRKPLEAVVTPTLLLSSPAVCQ